MVWSMRLRVGAAFVVGAALLLGACGDDGKPAASVRAGTYVGQVTGTDAYIALVTDGSTVSGYVCDARETSISIWLGKPALKGTKVSLTGRDGAALGEATFSGSRVSGELVLASVRRAFSASLASGEAGLYRLPTGTAGAPGFRETGWIVLLDGSERGITNNVNPNDPNDLVTESPPARKDSGATRITDPDQI